MTEEQLKTYKEKNARWSASDQGQLDAHVLADIARQLTIANEIATRRHQIEYSLAFRINDKISYEVDSPVDISIPALDAPTDALMEAVKEITYRSFGGGSSVTNCVEHSPMKILKRPEDCKLCQTDVKNRLSHAFDVNKFLNQLIEDLKSALAAHEKAVT